VEDLRVKKQKGQRRGQKHQARQTVEKVQHRIEVAQPLPQVQALAKQRVIGTENLRHAPCPADPLADMARQAFSGQPRRLRNRQVGGVIAGAVELERGMGIFGHGFDRHPADFHQRLAADHRTGATEKRGVPQVVTVLHQTVEQFAFVGYRTKGVEVLFERVRRKEKVRRLQHRQLRVFQKPANTDLQKGSGRYMVGIEKRHEFTAGDLQRFVEVAGLGMPVVVAGDVIDIDLLAELAKVFAPAVIKHMHAQLVFGPVHRLGGKDGQLHDIEGFVI